MNPLIRFNASAHHRPLEHFDSMQPATRLIKTFPRKVSLTFIYLLFFFYYNKAEVHLSYYRAQ